MGIATNLYVDNMYIEFCVPIPMHICSCVNLWNNDRKYVILARSTVILLCLEKVHGVCCVNINYFS